MIRTFDDHSRSTVAPTKARGFMNVEIFMTDLIGHRMQLLSDPG
jgi:hypothetical protein